MGEGLVTVEESTADEEVERDPEIDGEVGIEEGGGDPSEEKAG